MSKRVMKKLKLELRMYISELFLNWAFDVAPNVLFGIIYNIYIKRKRL